MLGIQQVAVVGGGEVWGVEVVGGVEIWGLGRGRLWHGVFCQTVAEKWRKGALGGSAIECGLRGLQATEIMLPC